MSTPPTTNPYLPTLVLDPTFTQPITPNAWHPLFSNFTRASLTVAVGSTYNQFAGVVLTAPTPEHIYQSLKTLNPTLRERILSCDSPAKAKAYGRGLAVRPHWYDDGGGLSLLVMWEIVQHRYDQHLDFADALMSTGTKPILEVTYWGDRKWGCTQEGVGANVLGQMLVALREEKRLELDKGD